MKPSIFDCEMFRRVQHVPFSVGDDVYQLSTYPYLDIVLTDFCNSRCKFCIADLLESKLVCDPDVFKEQISWAVENMGVREVLLLGGEPTVSRHLFEMVDFCRGLELSKICVTSNGKRCHQDPGYAKQLMSSGITHLNVSIMSFNQQAQQFVHRMDNNLTLDGLERMKQLADDWGVHLRVNTNVYRGNHDTIGGMVQWFEMVAPYCDSLKFSPLLRTDAFSVVPEVNAFNRDFILAPDEYESLFDGFVSAFDGFPVVVNPCVFGFVEYKMTVTSTPVLLNYNHRGQMMKRAVEFREINNVKLLPNGNLSRSWNREELDHVIRFPSCNSAPWQDTSTEEGVRG